ncbi:MAG: hypothetical protein CMJ39_07750 [Phycisphaerae bacterium]|nr:hypothetical protein [Phycisphaerae bacterium]
MVDRLIRTRAFTLLELLVVIAIIVIVTALTLMAYRGVASDVRMSAAIQDVASVLEEARARAIRDGRATVVAFRSQRTSGGEDYVEAIVGQASGETFLWDNRWGQTECGQASGETNPPYPRYPSTRFIPVGGLEPREMPQDIGFAVPALQFGDDEMYLATAPVGVSGQAPGIIPALMFGPDGEPVSYDQETDSSFIFMDFDGDGGQRMKECNACNHDEPSSFGGPDSCPPGRRDGFQPGYAPSAGCYLLNARNPETGIIDGDDVIFNEDIPMCQFNNGDEPFLVLSTTFMMFDERGAREEYLSGNWTDDKLGAAIRGKEINEFIRDNGMRIRLNRYTGVSQRD